MLNLYFATDFHYNIRKLPIGGKKNGLDTSVQIKSTPKKHSLQGKFIFSGM